jgi:hypothetical protein
MYMGVENGQNGPMPARTTGSRLKLGQPLADDLLDFCEAHRGAPEIRIIRDALRTFIDERLDAEPELKKRFHEARRRRLGAAGENIAILRTGK